jgi:hypothetical protein
MPGRITCTFPNPLDLSALASCIELTTNAHGGEDWGRCFASTPEMMEYIIGFEI